MVNDVTRFELAQVMSVKIETSYLNFTYGSEVPVSGSQAKRFLPSTNAMVTTELQIWDFSRLFTSAILLFF